jgi:hypothetical protein
MSIDPLTSRPVETRPALPLVLVLLGWAALVYLAYAASYLG